ncbi:MAG: adenosine-specific kinase [Thermoleophilia bacterium]|nr:adenosine-specific kinase [Thermoleophilia bacterium]
MDTTIVSIDKPDEMNMILGQAHFIKTVEDLHEVMAACAPGIRFGIGFCEASGPCLVRGSGNDERLIELALLNANALGTGHAFIILMENGFPINVLNAIKQVPEVCGIFCATANPVEVVVAESKLGRGIIGVIDGHASKGLETDSDIIERKELLRSIGYKL